MTITAIIRKLDSGPFVARNRWGETVTVTRLSWVGRTSYVTVECDGRTEEYRARYIRRAIED